ncbi:hypothetical protein F5Y04DRAFT_290489 [Hypomontagnella monticulosa]|nr:hypothetical protein F5Y04DRAFT_290489 [Hypomontagnella monticulosa]
MDAIGGEARIRDAEWEDHKHEIIDLYLGHELTLNELKERMKGRLDASASQFEAQLKAWNARKNLKRDEWERVFDEMDKLPPDTRSQVAISGYKVSDRKLQRARQARKRRARELRRPQHGSEHSETLNIQLPEGVSIEILPPTRTLSSLTVPSAVELVRTHIDSGVSFDDSLSLVSNASVHTQNPIETISLANAGDPCLHEDQHRALSRRSTNTTYQSRMRLNPDPHLSNRVAAALMLQNLGVIENAHLLQAWLNTLPSILFEDRIYPSLPSNLTTLTGPGDIISAATSAQNRWIQLFRDVMPLEDAPTSHSSGPWPVSLVHTIRSFLQGGSIKISDNPNVAITSTDEILIRLIIQSIINRFSGLEEIPIDSIVRLLGRFQNLMLVLMQVLKGNRNRAAQSLAENLFRAAVDANEPRLLGQLLQTDLIGLNEGHFPNARTPIQYAFWSRNLEIIKLMIHYGAHVDTRPQDTLNIFLTTIASASGITTGWEDIFHALLEAGAKVDLDIIEKMKSKSLSADMVSLLLRNVSPVYHEKVIKTCLAYIAGHFDDSRATEEVCNMIRTCERFHDGKCVLKFPKEIAKALIVSAGDGKCSLLKLLLPYLAQDSRYYRKILTASIMSCDDGLINSILEKMPDVRPRFYVRSSYPLRNAQASTPLEAAILTQNGQLIHRFEEAGALVYFDDHPEDQHSLGVLISAACRVRYMDYARKLLAARRPLRSSQGLTNALIFAMIKGEQSIVFELIHTIIPANEEYEVYINGTTKTYTPLTAAVALKNREYVRAILSEDVGEEGDWRTFAEAMKWGDESIITDLLTVYPNFKNFVLAPGDARIGGGTFHILTGTNNDTLDFLIDSAATTRGALNTYLEWAICNHSSENIQKLLDRGADPSKVLKLAAQEYPSALGVLLNQIVEGIKPVINDSGMLALVAAIEGGPESIRVLDALLRTELFDLKRKGLLFMFNIPFPVPLPPLRIYPPPPVRGPPPRSYNPDYVPHARNYISPLGLAIKNEKNHDPDLLIINRLLIAGCDVNSIAHRRYRTEKTSRKWGIVGESALLMAIATKNERLVRLLIDHGADVNSKIVLILKQTPLQCAAEVGNLSIVKILLEHGAEINAEPAIRGGGTALQFAAIGGSCIVAAELLRLGADLYGSPSKACGRWPLEGAAENGRLDMIDFLWKANENLKAMGRLPKTTGFEPERCLSAMRLARENGYLACEGLIADLYGQPLYVGGVPKNTKARKSRRHASTSSSSDSDASYSDVSDSEPPYYYSEYD